jgi:hypothetical protein
MIKIGDYFSDRDVWLMIRITKIDSIQSWQRFQRRNLNFYLTKISFLLHMTLIDSLIFLSDQPYYPRGIQQCLLFCCILIFD